MTEIMGQLATIVAVLTLAVNLITEVAKNAFPALNSKAEYINRFVLILSEILTIGSGLIYTSYKNIPVTCSVIAILVVVGFGVSYAAMFGYDKLISYFKKEKSNETT